MHTILEASLYGTPVLAFNTGLGDLAGSEQIRSTPDAWKLTGAWTPETTLEGRHIERWLLGLRPQGGAQTAQTARAAEELGRLGIRRTAPSQGDIIWASRQTEFAGAVQFRSLAEGKEIEPEAPPDIALESRDLEELLDQVIEEMRHGTIEHWRLGIPPITPSGSLPKFAVHRHPVTGDWHVPGKTPTLDPHHQA